VSDAVDTERAIAELEAALIAAAPGYRELAQRIVMLEQRCAKLESELLRIDQRLTKLRLDRWDVP
jgi:hypothetical protein